MANELQESNINAFKNLMLTGGIYSSIDVDEHVKQSLIYASNAPQSLDLYCSKCNCEKTYVYTSTEAVSKMGNVRFIYAGQSCRVCRLTSYFYKCASCGQIVYYQFYCADDKLIKLAQYPTLVDVRRDEYKRYEKNKLIDKDYFKEIYKAETCMSSGYFVAAYIYLRRVLENLIKNVFEKNKEEIGSTLEEFSVLRMDKKLSKISEYLPLDKGLYTPLYSLLSEGIHALSESECESNYKLIMCVVLDILAEEQADRERIARRKSINKVYSDKKGANK